MTNRRRLLLLGLFVLVGVNLRTVLLGVPPILPLIQHTLGLSHTGLGLLTALPVLVMGLAAWPAGLLMAKLGGRTAVAIGLALVAAGAMLRAVGASVLPLYVFTVALSLGIALAQTSVVALVRLWFPQQIGLASALYTDGIISGEALAAGLTIPVLLGWFGHDAWRAALAAWGLPVLAVLMLWLIVAPGGHARADPRPSRIVAPSTGSTRVAGRPLWLMALHLGLLSGCSSLIYFNMNAWTAPYNAAFGHSDQTALSLALLNAAQLPVSFAITPVAQRLTGRRLPLMASGVLCLGALAGWIWMPAASQPFWAIIFGASTVTILVLGIALPPYFATPATVARLVGAALTVSYLLSFCGQLLGATLWDITGRPAFVFLPVAVASALLILLAALLPRRRNDSAPAIVSEPTSSPPAIRQASA